MPPGRNSFMGMAAGWLAQEKLPSRPWPRELWSRPRAPEWGARLTASQSFPSEAATGEFGVPVQPEWQLSGRKDSPPVHPCRSLSIVSGFPRWCDWPSHYGKEGPLGAAAGVGIWGGIVWVIKAETVTQDSFKT